MNEANLSCEKKETFLDYNQKKSKTLSQIKKNLNNKFKSDVENDSKEFFI